jgi:hypothetical protein
LRFLSVKRLRLTIRSDSIYRTGLESFHAQLSFGCIDWLLVDEGETARDVPLKVVGCHVPADVAVDARVIDVEFAGLILRKS